MKNAKSPGRCWKKLSARRLIRGARRSSKKYSSDCMARKHKMLRHWILDDKGRPVETDLFTWAKWFETAKRIVIQETIAQNRVSTIFLGIDHSFAMEGPPV